DSLCHDSSAQSQVLQLLVHCSARRRSRHSACQLSAVPAVRASALAAAAAAQHPRLLAARTRAPPCICFGLYSRQAHEWPEEWLDKQPGCSYFLEAVAEDLCFREPRTFLARFFFSLRCLRPGLTC